MLVKYKNKSKQQWRKTQNVIHLSWTGRWDVYHRIIGQCWTLYTLTHSTILLPYKLIKWDEYSAYFGMWFALNYRATNLSRLQLTVGSSILFTRTIRCLTPAVLANIACSRVCPPFSKPVSNSPFLAEITWGLTQSIGHSQTIQHPDCISLHIHS